MNKKLITLDLICYGVFHFVNSKIVRYLEQQREKERIRKTK